MSTSRLKDQADYDLEQIIGIIDSALESDDQRIKDALRALMTITVLCTAQHPDQAVRFGPLARVFEDMRNLNQRLNNMERDLDNVKMRMPPPTAAPYNPFPGTTNPWGPGGGGGPPGLVGPWIGTPNSGQPWTGTSPNAPKPMWGPSYTSAGDDPAYKGASSSVKLAEDFLKELEKR